MYIVQGPGGRLVGPGFSAWLALSYLHIVLLLAISGGVQWEMADDYEDTDVTLFCCPRQSKYIGSKLIPTVHTRTGRTII